MATIVMGLEQGLQKYGGNVVLEWANFVFARIPENIPYLVLVYEASDVSRRYYDDIPISRPINYRSDIHGDNVDIWKCASLAEAHEIFSKLADVKTVFCWIVSQEP